MSQTFDPDEAENLASEAFTPEQVVQRFHTIRHGDTTFITPLAPILIGVSFLGGFCVILAEILGSKAMTPTGSIEVGSLMLGIAVVAYILAY